MKMKTILLTGTSGVVGRQLASKLIEDFRIIAVGSDYSRIPESLRHHKNLKFYERNLLQIQSEKELSITEHIDIILHLAGAVSGTTLSEEEFFKINAQSTRLLLNYANLNKCMAFGLASSVSVYGFHERPIFVSSERKGKSVYARSKIAAEDYCKSSQIPTSIFRIASVYGKGTKSFVSKLRALHQKGFYPSIKGERKKSLLHIADLVSALEKWCRKAANRKPILPVYVLSHPQAATIQDVIGAFRNETPDRFGGLGIPIYGFFIPFFNFLYKWFRRIRKLPYHASPLEPLLSSIEIFDEGSWKDLEMSPKWDLRKGISEYQ
jgi:UDP-glucose 4-epimerase